MRSHLLSSASATRKLVVACTFRSFDGTSNDAIQRKFIESLALQKYPFHLVITQWNELGVEDALSAQGVKFSRISGTGEKWSLSQVFFNAQQLFPEANILWSTVDLSFSPHLFYDINSALLESDFVTSWPHLNTVDTLEGHSRIHMSELDLVAISSRITKKVCEQITKHRNIGWGLFEHQLCAFARQASPKVRAGINIYNKAKITKTENPKTLLKELPERLRSELAENVARWKPWLNTYWRLQNLNLDFVLLRLSGTPLKIRIKLVKRYSKNVIRLIRNKFKKKLVAVLTC